MSLDKIKNTDNKKSIENTDFLFSKKKYIILIFSMLLLILGFLLMSGGGAEGSEFNPEIFSSRRIVFAPLIIIIAFIMSLIAIMIKK